VVGAIYIIVDGVVKVVAVSADEPWLAVLKILLAAATPAGITVGWLWNKYTRFVNRNTAEIATRNAELESQMDPDRSSSALLRDGSDPPGTLQ